MDARPPIDNPRGAAWRPTFRFAPSPNGYLHRGHAFSALLNADLAARSGGRFLLRLEDIDRERCRPAFAEAIEADLAWLGLAWERPVRRQSDHLGTYRTVLGGLVSRGLAFPCFCTRGAIAAAAADRAASTGRPPPRDPDGAPLYPGTCKALGEAERRDRLATGQPAAFRLDMAAALGTLAGPLAWWDHGGGGNATRVAAEPERWGDALIGRRDVPTSYHLSVVVDDAAQGVTEVVRGQDLVAATALHRLLQALLGLPEPRYRHHPLILDAAGRKLSKSRGAPTLRDLRLGGVAPGTVRRDLGFG